jgi:hypothetical protein
VGASSESFIRFIRFILLQASPRALSTLLLYSVPSENAVPISVVHTVMHCADMYSSRRNDTREYLFVLRLWLRALACLRAVLNLLFTSDDKLTP